MMQQVRMLIAYQVRLLRLQRELSKADLAEKSKLSIKKIEEIENWDIDISVIKIKSLEKIAHALDCGLRIGFTGWEDVVASIVPGYLDS